MPIKLSIIIPFFNRAKYAMQLIESVPVRNEIEILVVDDKSTPEETRQLKEYLAQQATIRTIHYFYNDETKSAGTCRNIALRHAVGEWLLFADADDYFMPNLYEMLEEWFEQPVDIVYFTPTSVDRLTGLISERHLGGAELILNCQNNPCDETLYRLKSFFVVPWSKLIRRSVVQQHEIYYEEIIASNDVMFATKVAFATQRIATSTSIIYCVTKSPGTLTYSVQREVLDARLGAFIRHYHFIKANMPKDVFHGLALNGRASVIQYVAQKQSMRAVLWAMWMVIKNGVPFFEWRLLNPVRLKNGLKGHLEKHKRNKKYYEAHN